MHENASTSQQFKQLMIDKKTFYNWNAAYISNKYISAIKSKVKRALKTMINGEKSRNATPHIVKQNAEHTLQLIDSNT